MISKDEVQIELSMDFESYIAEVHELPGCVASGETENEALENIRPIIDEWIAGAKARGETRKSQQYDALV